MGRRILLDAISVYARILADSIFPHSRLIRRLENKVMPMISSCTGIKSPAPEKFQSLTHAKRLVRPISQQVAGCSKKSLQVTTLVRRDLRSTPRTCKYTLNHKRYSSLKWHNPRQAGKGRYFLRGRASDTIRLGVLNISYSFESGKYCPYTVSEWKAKLMYVGLWKTIRHKTPKTKILRGKKFLWNFHIFLYLCDSFEHEYFTTSICQNLIIFVKAVIELKRATLDRNSVFSHRYLETLSTAFENRNVTKRPHLPISSWPVIFILGVHDFWYFANTLITFILITCVKDEHEIRAIQFGKFNK